MTLSAGRVVRVLHPEGGHVFEDLAPRLWDVTGDGTPEVVVVETDPRRGAQLAVYGLTGEGFGKTAATPHIGQPNRWLAPVAAADLDGDGRIEVAYVDRPHLARTLRIWRYGDGRLVEVARAEGLTNHRIGEAVIHGGLRRCGEAPELITANADWSRVMASRLTVNGIVTRDIGPLRGPRDIEAALACR